MRVALAYPYDGHAPDEVIELDRREALRLIGSGRARLVPDVDEPEADESGTQRPPFDLGAALADPTVDAAAIARRTTVAALVELAALRSVDVADDATKAQLVAAIRAAQETRVSTDGADPATEQQETP